MALGQSILELVLAALKHHLPPFEVTTMANLAIERGHQPCGDRVMTSVKNQTRFDEPVTQEVLTQAIERGRKRSGEGLYATSVKYVPLLKSLLVSFADHSAVALPVKNYPELAALTSADLNKLSLGFGGSALCLDARDLHVSIAGLVSASERT